MNCLIWVWDVYSDLLRIILVIIRLLWHNNISKTPPTGPLCHTSSQKYQLPPPSECNIIYGWPLGNNNVHFMALREKLVSMDIHIFCLFYVIFFVIFTSLRIIFLLFLTLPVIDFATTNCWANLSFTNIFVSEASFFCQVRNACNFHFEPFLEILLSDVLTLYTTCHYIHITSWMKNYMLPQIRE